MDKVLYHRGCDKLEFQEAPLEGWKISRPSGGGSTGSGLHITKQHFFAQKEQELPADSVPRGTDLFQWLGEGISAPGSLRLLISRWPPQANRALIRSRSVVRSRMLLTLDDFNKVVDTMKLPLAFPFHYSTSNFVARSFYTPDESLGAPYTAIFQTPARPLTFFSLALSYDTVTRTTNAYLIGTEGGDLVRFLKRLEDAASQANHPLLLLLLLYLLYIEVVHADMNELLENVQRIQIDTDQMDPTWVFIRKNDHMSSSNLSTIHKRIATIQERVTGVQRDATHDFTECLRESFAAIEANKGCVDETTHKSLKATFLDLRQIASLESRNETRYEAKLHFQHKVLYHLMQQHDSSLSQGLAVDSKKIAESSQRDSLSMKAIGALTMFFLPGTAIATIFSMSQFFVLSSGDLHASSTFWMFWAVTIPLTIAVMITWFFAAQYSQRLRDKKLRQIELGSGFPDGETEKTEPVFDSHSYPLV